MSRHAADRALARVRAWWTERRDRRDARDDEEALFHLDGIGTPEDQDFDIFGPGLFPTRAPRTGNRYQGEHARPGDIPDQPAGGGA